MYFREIRKTKVYNIFENTHSIESNTDLLQKNLMIYVISSECMTRGMTFVIW